MLKEYTHKNFDNCIFIASKSSMGNSFSHPGRY